MYTIEELINSEEPGWGLVEEWIKTAANKVEILPADPEKAKEALFQTQLSTRSPMGAIIYSTGGILVDNGWIRILGSGSPKMQRTVPGWNEGKASSSLLIADDAIGGFFLLNGGALGEDLGMIYYFAPDSLEYEPLDIGYSDFLNFCFNADLDDFYGNYRWENWEDEVKELSPDTAFSFYPFLWKAEGRDISKNRREAVSIEEIYHLNCSMREQQGQSN